jgi:cytidyltransferase-like protein
MKQRKVLVSGCFDCLHSGHVAFLNSAAQFGDLYVCLGNDANVFSLKNRTVFQSETERIYMLSALRCVQEVRLSQGMGLLDFEDDLRQIQPDVFVVNEDGHTEQKQNLCKELGIQYEVLKRTPEGELPARSTTEIRKGNRIPYRLDLAGGWLDQPFVSNLCAGPVITISVEVDFEVNHRSGMASSTHQVATDLWGHQIPIMPLEKAAKLLFACDNPPGKATISGSQDSIGIVYPGVNKLNYNGSYWPEFIESSLQEDVLQWLESKLFLIPIFPRPHGFEVLDEQHLVREFAQELSIAAENTWKAILDKNLHALGLAMTQSLKAQCKMFPLMWSSDFDTMIQELDGHVMGYKISGAGGGGYLLVVAEQGHPTWKKVKIKRGNLV